MIKWTDNAIVNLKKSDIAVWEFAWPWLHRINNGISEHGGEPSSSIIENLCT